MVIVLLSASVERFSVYRMQDFLKRYPNLCLRKARPLCERPRLLCKDMPLTESQDLSQRGRASQRQIGRASHLEEGPLTERKGVSQKGSFAHREVVLFTKWQCQ